MPRRFSFALLAVVVAGLTVFGALRLFQLVTAEHDGWGLFSPVEVTTDPLVVDASMLFTREEEDEIERIVNESRTYGIPWTIRVIRPSDDAGSLSAQELTEQSYAERPVETVEEAGDGLLMLVAVPIGEPTATEVAFASGPNFYPRGGITPARLEEIVNVQMAQAIEEGRLGDAVIEGATWVEWTHLFESTPEPESTNLERGLRDLLEPLGALAFAGLAAAVLVAAAVVLVVTKRGANSTPDTGSLDGVLAAVIARGRVDRPVVTGAVLDAAERGVLRVDPDGTVGTGSAPSRQERDTIISSTLGDRRLAVGALVRDLRRKGDLARTMEDRLATSGAFRPKSPILTLWLRWIAVGGLLLGVLGLVLSVLGSARYALAAALALTVIGLVVALWNERRSWTTLAGKRALSSWREQHREADDTQRALFETIIGMETLAATRDPDAPVEPGVWRALPDPY